MLGISVLSDKHTHSRTVDGELHIWDVEALWVLSQNLSVRKMLVENVPNLDDGVWQYKDESVSVRDVVEHCQRILDADLSYPIILCPNGEVMDGYHRVAKCLLNKIDEIQFVQFEQLPTPTQ